MASQFILRMYVADIFHEISYLLESVAVWNTERMATAIQGDQPFST